MIIQVASTDSSIDYIQNYLNINTIGALTLEGKKFWSILKHILVLTFGMQTNW